MGRRGPPKKPTTLKILAGNPGHRPLNDDEPKPDPLAAVPPPPVWLNNVAKAEWKRIGAELVKLGLLSSIDVAQLACYCSAYADVIAAEKLIAKFGTTYETDKGNTVQHPAVGQKNRAMEIVHKFAGAFGLTPSSRAGITVNAPKASGIPVRKRG